MIVLISPVQFAEKSEKQKLFSSNIRATLDLNLPNGGYVFEQVLEQDILIVKTVNL